MEMVYHQLDTHWFLALPKKFFVHRKDPHPLQWIISEKAVFMENWERKKKHNIEREIAFVFEDTTIGGKKNWQKVIIKTRIRISHKLLFYTAVATHTHTYRYVSISFPTTKCMFQNLVSRLVRHATDVVLSVVIRIYLNFLFILLNGKNGFLFTFHVSDQLIWMLYCALSLFTWINGCHREFGVQFNW